MTKHPLTDDKTLELIPPEVMEKPEDYASYLRGIPVSDAMRLAKDWQLEQVMKCLDEYLDDYSISDRWGYCGANQLKARLARAMRPQEDN